MNWCCFAFKGHSENAGQRGLGIYVEVHDKDPKFVLQWRSVDNPISFQSEQAISLMEEVKISFCPWCGVRLSEFYSSSYKELARPDLRIV